MEQSSILLSKDISIIEKLAAKRRRAAEMETTLEKKKLRIMMKQKITKPRQDRRKSRDRI